MMREIGDAVIRIPPLFVMDFILHKINSSSPIEFIVETTSQIFNFALDTKFLYFGLGQIIILLSKPFGIAAALTILVLPHVELAAFYRSYLKKLSILLMCFYLSNWFLLLAPPPTSSSFIAPFTHLFGTYANVVFSLCSLLVVLAASHTSIPYEPLSNRKLNALCATLLPCFLLLSMFHRQERQTTASTYSVSSSTVWFVACYLALTLMTPYLVIQARAYVAWFRGSVMTGSGIVPCLQHEWGRLHFTPLLKIYWVFKVGAPVLIRCVAWTFNDKLKDSLEDSENVGSQRHPCQGSAISVATYFFRSLTIRSCDTTVTLLSTALTLSYVVDKVYRHLDSWLSIPLGPQPTAPLQSSSPALTEEPSLGTASAILFLILAAQTGITASASFPVKLDRIGRNVVLMSVALLHLLHDTVIRPRLMSLAASGNTSRHRHARAHLLAWSIFGLAAWIGQHYYASHQLISTRGSANSTQPQTNSKFSCDDANDGEGTSLFGIAPFPSHSTLINSWLVSIAVLSAELCSKVTVSLLTYGLRLIDFHRNALLTHQATSTLVFPESLLKSFLGKNEDACKWDLRLDRALWYVGSIGGVTEFAFGLILFFNALWILTFESRNGGAIRAAMTLLHAYFNLWLRAQKGMGSFLRRLRVDRRLARLHNKLAPTSSNPLETDLTCPICRVAITNHECGSRTEADYVITDCGHPFHSPCLRRWLYTREDCPMCRTPVSPLPTTSTQSYF